jgi:hypothetical protein
MSLKKIVNDKELWDALVSYYDSCIITQHVTMERLSAADELHRAQGAINMLRKLKLMRDEINGRK